MRIGGVNIPSEKRLVVGLTYVYGIGSLKAREICKKACLSESLRVRDLSETDVAAVRSSIDDLGLKIEGDLRRDVSGSIKRLMDLGCYRGLRHRKKLPVRGQRTHTNARTRKGKAVAIAGKKK